MTIERPGAEGDEPPRLVQLVQPEANSLNHKALSVPVTTTSRSLPIWTTLGEAIVAPPGLSHCVHPPPEHGLTQGLAVTVLNTHTFHGLEKNLRDTFIALIIKSVPTNHSTVQY
ncbi:MAG TPA: hypothetical protein VNA15_02485 [Candidatus Angelobacter sp.]|nr:hypothetical protein [Candidatus Angelobacter sp.]